DDALGVDGILVNERERARNAYRDVDLGLAKVRVVHADRDVGRKLCGARCRAGARRKCGERQCDDRADDHAVTDCDLRRMTIAPRDASAMPMSAIWSLEG